MAFAMRNTAMLKRVCLAALLVLGCSKVSIWEQDARAVGDAELASCRARLAPVSAGGQPTAAQRCFEIWTEDNCQVRSEVATWEKGLMSARSNGKLRIARLGLEQAKSKQARLDEAYKLCLAYAEKAG